MNSPHFSVEDFIKEPTSKEIIKVLKHLCKVWKHDTNIKYILGIYETQQIKKDVSSSAGDHLGTRNRAEEERYADKGLSTRDTQSAEIPNKSKKGWGLSYGY